MAKTRLAPRAVARNKTKAGKPQTKAGARGFHFIPFRFIFVTPRAS